MALNKYMEPSTEQASGVLGLVMQALARMYPAIEFTPSTRVFENGLEDSLAIVEIIVQVERESGLEFDASQFGDLEEALTPLRLARAFT